MCRPLYTTLGDRPIFATLVRNFAAHLPGMIERIRLRLHAGALDDVRKLAHRLKGSSGGYGFPDIMRAAAALETSAATGDVATAAIRLDELAALCERAAIGARGTEGS